MLTISRKQNQAVVIFTGADEQVSINIDAVDGKQVKLSFRAPDSVIIMREELLPLEPVSPSHN